MTSWFGPLVSTALARERVGSTFCSRLGWLIVAQMCSARATAASASARMAAISTWLSSRTRASSAAASP
ncbi:hypothetical protein, partial [Mycolicibacterium poriferae]|uniref:hypothetical protein n=1 Tax=Mycolicibacterium poriferae TaxID=39694 RepID=UPI003D2F70F9